MIAAKRPGAVAAIALALVAASPAFPQALPLQGRVEARLAEAGPGVRFGLVVASEDGRELVAIGPEGRFVPASATKLFTTAAFFANVAGLDAPDAVGGASVSLVRRPGALPDVLLEGHGDARLSSAPDCVEDCLAALADAVAAKVRTVGDVVGDDSFFRDDRWSPGMSWNNIQTASGTAASALTVDDNETALLVAPAPAGRPPTLQATGYYILRNDAVTGAAGAAGAIDVERLPGERVLHVTGTIAADAKPQRIRLGIDDPAYHAAWRLRPLLEARGVRVAGATLARHRLAGAAPAPAAAAELVARLTPPPLLADLRYTIKVSQNLHAELFLRRLGRLKGDGSIGDGLLLVRGMLDAAGVLPREAEFADGSGMSTYNRVAPRGATRFLAWAARQPWGAAWRATFPVGGVDGTLSRRFGGGPLEGRIFAKTGSINQVSALVGYMRAKSGRLLAFAAFANDIPDGAPAARAMDAALELIASES